MGRLGGGMGTSGPRIDVKVMLPTTEVETRKKAGLDYGRPRVLRGLIDTGASCSAIDRDVAEDLKLTPRGFALVHTPTTGPDYVERLQYGACLVVGEGQPDALVLTLPVIESDLSTRDFQILVGRDVLRSCVFVYDGPTDVFTLEWSRESRDPATAGVV